MGHVRTDDAVAERLTERAAEIIVTHRVRERQGSTAASAPTSWLLSALNAEVKLSVAPTPARPSP